MIHKIYTDSPLFKEISFKKGLNIILSERSLNSSIKDTRNGTGKTTLIQIIHFCFGGSIDKLTLPFDDLKNWSFFIEFDLFDTVIVAKRSIDNPKIVYVNEVARNFTIAPNQNKENNELYYTLEEWKELLGVYFFGIKKSQNKDIKYTPTFRSLFPYFARNNLEAYNNPFIYLRQQKAYCRPLYNAYLLGLNWQSVSEAQEIKDQQERIKALKLALGTNAIASTGELEAARLRLEAKINDENKALESFKVHLQYKTLQEQVNHLTHSMHSLLNLNIVLNRKLTQYAEAVTFEKPPSSYDIEQLYAEAGLHFGDLVKKTLHDAKTFHEAIVKNRKLFLQAEFVQMKNQIDQNDSELKKLSDERASIMQLLSTHGALDEFLLLQDSLIKDKERLEKVRSTLNEMKEIKSKQKTLKAKTLELETIIQRDYEESRPDWEKAITVFNENSLALYDKPGNLIINTTEKGYSFDVEIQNSTSEGVNRMKIFCYDLMLVELNSKKGMIDFLIHDSTIFDAVDSRQRALALQHANNKALECNFQYICTLNSDMIPYDNLHDDFDIEDYIIRTICDHSPSDSLLGFHFEIKNKKRKTLEQEDF